MDEIRIENLRSLHDTGYIKLKNINILLGQNSSGKSTFARAFPLLKQSFHEKTKSGVLWYGPYVDFGSFKEAIFNSKPSNKDTVNFTFVINNLQTNPDTFSLFNYAALKNREPLIKQKAIKTGRIELTSKVSKDDQKRSELIIKAKTHTISIIITNQVILDKFEIDGIDIKDINTLGYRFYQHYGILPITLPTLPTVAASLEADLKKYSKIDLDHIAEIDEKKISGLTLDSCRDAQTLSKELGTPLELISEERLQQFSRYITIRDLPFIWDSLRDKISGSAKKTQYITPIRASAERYYRTQGLSVDELDPQGTNLAMFLNSLSQQEAKEFSSWTQENMGFAVQSKGSEGHVSILISDKDNKKINMADTGFGFSQVIPILAQIWKSTKSSSRDKDADLYVIEQPELHLHPKMQAKLADILISATKKGKNHNIKLLIETHSETFINQLGKAIDNSILTPDDVGIYLFEKNESDGKTTISESSFDEQGFLTKWPYGFFDS